MAKRNDSPTISNGGQIPKQIDPEIREIIRENRDDPAAAQKESDRSGPQVTPKLCALLRYAHDQGDTKKAVSEEFGVPYRTVQYHTKGKCACEESVHIHYDECMRMRQRARRGAPTETLAVLNDISEANVLKHLSGRCRHDDGVRPLPTSRGPTPCSAKTPE
jgi:hypothetical protein